MPSIIHDDPPQSFQPAKELKVRFEQPLVHDHSAIHEHWQSLFEFAPNAYFMIDMSGRVIECNPATEQLSGYRREELIGGHLLHTTLFSLEQIPRLETAIAQCAGGYATRPGEYILRHKDRRRTCVEIATFPARIDDQLFVMCVARDITERKRTEEEIRTIARFPDENPNAILRISAECKLLYANAAGTQLLKALGSQYGHTIPSDWHLFIDQTLADNHSLEVDCRGDGRVYACMFVPIRVAAYVNVYVRDVTKRVETEQALRQSEAQYRALFNTIADPIFIFDQETKLFLDCNQPALRLYDYSLEELRTMRPHDLHPIEDLQRVERNIHDRTARGPHRYTHITKGGRRIQVEVHSSEVQYAGHAAWISIVRDISEHLRAEEAIRQSQKTDGLGILASGVAHDFNNLLVAILGQTALALNHMPVDSEARLHLNKAIKATERAADLARQMLAYCGHAEFESRPLQLNTLVTENLHLFEALIPKHIRLTADLTEPLPLIEADAGQIQQVIMNLLLNATEAIEGRSGHITVATRLQSIGPDEAQWIRWSEHEGEDDASFDRDYIVLEVIDNGCGMDANTLTHIFEPFFSTKSSGHGLGLAVALGIMHTHRGGLQVHSEHGKGTHFKLFFHAGAIEPHMLDPQPIVSSHAHGQLVLVIGDEEPVREAVSDTLSIDGFKVLVASNGEEGIALYRDHARDIMLVLLDLSMPDIDGEEVFRQLRKINPKVCVIVSSGYSKSEVLRRFPDVNPIGFLQKPYNADKLIQTISQHLQT